MNVIEKAIGFAVKAHAGALRKGTNLPYILHPLEAASIAAQMTDDQEIIAATVLHDTVGYRNLCRRHPERIRSSCSGACKQQYRKQAS